MYMLRTEIRKLGGLICFLFVMLAIQAQQYTVTGGNAFLLYYPDLNPLKTVAFCSIKIQGFP